MECDVKTVEERRGTAAGQRAPSRPGHARHGDGLHRAGPAMYGMGTARTERARVAWWHGDGPHRAGQATYGMGTARTEWAWPHTLVVFLLLPLVDVQGELLHPHPLFLLCLLLVPVIGSELGRHGHIKDLKLGGKNHRRLQKTERKTVSNKRAGGVKQV